METGSYLLLEPGMTVRNQAGDDLGTIAEVVADEIADIFRGVTVSPGLFAHDVFVPGEHVIAVAGNVATIDLDHDALTQLQPASELATRS